MRQQQLQLLASLRGSANPFLPNLAAPHHPSHPQPQMPNTPNQVQAAVALLATSTQGNGMSSASFPPATGMRRPDAPLVAPDSSSSPDAPSSGNAAALAALIAASVSSSGGSAGSTSEEDSAVAIRAYRDYLNLTNKFQSEQNRKPEGSDKTVKQMFNSISSTLDKPHSDSIIADSLATSKQNSMSHSPAVLLMAEQLLRDAHSLPTTTTSALTSASPIITSRPSVESTQAKIPMTTPFNVRPNLSNQENSLKRDFLSPTYSSSHHSTSSDPPYRRPIINAEDAKKLNLQLQQQADAAHFVKLLAEGSPNVLQVSLNDKNEVI